MKKICTSLLTLTFLLGLIYKGNSQSTNEIAGAAYGALSNSGVADQNVWQGFLNPAGLITTSEKWQAGINYSSRFALSELSSRDLVASLPTKNGRLGLVVHSFGYSAYTQNQFSGAYAMNLSSKLRAGIQLNYFNVSIGEGYGRFSALSGNVGFQYDFNSRISIGFLVKNPTRAQLSSEVQEYVESEVRGGMKFQLAENLLVLADVSKNLDFNSNLSVGIEYNPLDEWFLRGGVSTLDNGISFGFGYRPAKWSFDLASLYHQTLGFSPMISFTYRND